MKYAILFMLVIGCNNSKLPSKGSSQVETYYPCTDAGNKGGCDTIQSIIDDTTSLNEH